MKLLSAILLPLVLCSPVHAVDWELWNSHMIEVTKLAAKADFRAAMPLAIRAVEQARLGGSGDGRLAESLDTLGFLYCLNAEYRLSEKAFLEAIAIARPLPAYQPQLARSLDHLAYLYHEIGGRTAEVESLRRQAVEIAVTRFGPDAPEVGALLSRLATPLIERGKHNEAEDVLKRALQLIGEQRYPALAADIYCNLGAVAYHKRKYSEALEAFERAGQLYGQVARPGSPGFVSQLSALGAIYLKMGRAQEADQALEQAEQLATKVYGPDHPRVAEVLSFRIESLRKLGKRREADQAIARVRAIDAASRPETNAVNSRVNLSLTYRE